MSSDLFNRITYVIDTSALINLQEKFDYDNPVFKAIWEEIEDLILRDNFTTIDFVEKEIIDDYLGKKDFLIKWIKRFKRKKKFVKKIDEPVINAAIPIINAEYTSGFLNQKKLADGKDEADPYLIAFCKVHGYKLISDEKKFVSNKIPEVGRKNGVVCINLYDFFEERGLKMVRKNGQW